MKKCTTCGSEKPLDQFSKDKTKKDGLRGCCKSCSPHKRYGKMEERQPLDVKRCRKCKQRKEIDEFSKDKYTKDGYKNVCKECNNKIFAEWRTKNKQRVSDIYGDPKTENKIKTCVSCGESKKITYFYKSNGFADGYKGTCKKCSFKLLKEHDIKTNGESAFKRTISSQKASRRIEATSDEILALYYSSPHCHYCNVFLELRYVVIEHKTPISRGGSGQIDNIAISCDDCNRLKWTRTEEEFFTFLLEYKDRISKKKRTPCLV